MRAAGVPAIAAACLVACASHPPAQRAAPSAAPATAMPSPPSTAETDMDQYAHALIEGQWCTALVIATLDGEHEIVRGYGRTREGAPPNGDTVFEIGSVSKVFTSLLLADAIARSETQLDAPLQSLLGPAFHVPVWSSGRAVTLVDLATHTSGLPRLPPVMGGGPPTDPYAGFDRAAAVQSLAQTTLSHEPGTHYEYSNFAAGLLGFALADHAHTTFESLLQQRIAGPLGLRDTTVTLSEAQRARFVQGHDADGAVTPPWQLGLLAGAGGIRSTAHDLVRFLRAEISPPREMEHTFRLTQTSRVPQEGHAGSVALGWHLLPDGQVRWHNGGTGGFHSYVAFDPDAHKGVVVLADTSTDAVDAVGAALLARLRGAEVTPLTFRPLVPMTPTVLDRFAGTYLLGATAFVVTRDGDFLRAQLGTQPAIRIYPVGPTEFVYRVVAASLTFSLDADGRATQVTLHQNGRDLPMARVP